MINRHFFFKFKKGNSGFIEFKKHNDFNERSVPLPIYFGPWAIEQYLNNKTSIDFGNSRQKGHREIQVETFFKLKASTDNTYFWIFFTDEIYAIELNKPYEIFQIKENQPDYLVHSDKNESIPKFFYGSIVKEFSKNSLPESFANINSNQKYNRKTIVELTDIEYEIANCLISENDKMSISKDKLLYFLSPVQFETLIFLIFVENNIYCSTNRGGTKEKYDLKIKNDKKIFDDFDDGIINIQIKLKREFFKPESDEKTVFFYLGVTNKELKLFGSDWIYKEVEKSEYIKNWLKESLDFFSIE